MLPCVVLYNNRRISLGRVALLCTGSLTGTGIEYKPEIDSK